MNRIGKLKNIEILRFFFIISVVCCHLKHGVIDSFYNILPLYDKLKENFFNSWIPVDFFFIISGFFLFLTTNFNQDFLDFAKKKFLRLTPLVFYSLILYFIFSLFTPVEFLKYENVFTLFNLQNVGLTFRNGNVPASWFISSLFWGLCFYFYFYKICDKRWFNLINACIIFLCHSFWIHSGNNNTENIVYVFNIGMMRAFAGIGTGYFISEIYKLNIEKIKNKVYNIYQKLLLTALEIYLLFFLVYYTFLHKLNYDNVLIFIIFFWLFLIKKGYLSQFFDNNFSVFLGQFTFAIFLTHQLIIKLWHFYICVDNSSWVILHPVINLVLLFTVIIGFGIFTYYAFEKPVTKYIKENF